MKVNNLIDVLLNNPEITFEAMEAMQQERKEKMYLASQTALEELEKKENASFSSILQEMQELYDKKNHDYGNSFSDTIKEFGLVPAVARINDKMQRLKQLVKGEEMQVNESMRDTLMDMANYCVLTIMGMDG